MIRLLLLPQVGDPMLKRNQSEQAYKKLCEVIPGGVNSPIRACKSMGQSPMVVEKAFADCVVDVDGHTYVDFCGSWGALIHGHAHAKIIQAAHSRMLMGTTFGITSSIEEQLARKVVGLVDSIDKIRFVSSGTEATMSAVRLARGFTKRELVIKFAGNYHGHADFFLVKAGSSVSELSASSSAGIPNSVVEHMLCLPFNDVETCRNTIRQHASKLAAVILEPVAGNIGVVPASAEFIQMLREETANVGALLIFDEVITGFRVGLKGAQAIYQVKPDLTCFGKIVGGGFPAAAFGGRKDIMDYLSPLGPVYQAGTLSGNPVAMAAGLEALSMLEEPHFYENLEKMTNLITDPLREVLSKNKVNACVAQVGSMFTLFFGQRKVSNLDEALNCDMELFAKFFRYMFASGVYIPPLQLEAWFVSSVHEEKNLVKTRDLILNFIKN
jgi:glutamate-1-semialdehyde 2,1-aminomutase